MSVGGGFRDYAPFRGVRIRSPLFDKLSVELYGLGSPVVLGIGGQAQAFVEGEVLLGALVASSPSVANEISCLPLDGPLPSQGCCADRVSDSG